MTHSQERKYKRLVKNIKPRIAYILYYPQHLVWRDFRWESIISMARNYNKTLESVKFSIILK